MRLITLVEYAKQLGISERTARKIASELPGAVRINKQIRYRSDSVAEFIAAGGRPTPAKIFNGPQSIQG